MKVYVYLDESGSIHKNSKTKYFAVGGYFVGELEKNKVISRYRKINKNIKDKYNLDLNLEIKANMMNEEDKIAFFRNIQNLETFNGCVKVFDKQQMKKDIIESNIFFNYAVKLVFMDCIIPFMDKGETIKFIVSIDNRNIRVGELNNLENYLKTEFCLNNYDFKVTYYDSKTNYGIQFADLIVNTFYNTYKDKTIVSKVLQNINNKKFRVRVFPGDVVKNL